MFLDKRENGKTFSIQDIAIKLSEEHLQNEQLESDPKERTIFILGSSGVGKSTVKRELLDKDEPIRPTLALEYACHRRQGTSGNIQKHILNIWEMGSLANSEQLIEVPLRLHGLQHFVAIIFVDLSQPKGVWVDLETAYRRLKAAVVNNITREEIVAIQGKAAERVGKDHPDLGTMELFPGTLLIVGGKYDIFMNFDPEVKKHICRCLRSMAHTLGAALLFYSHQLSKLSKSLKDVISYLGLGSPTQPIRSLNVDYNGPLSIWFGSDSWAQIGTHPLSIDHIGLTLGQAIPQLKPEKPKEVDDPAKDPGFRESAIDELRAQKDDILRTIIRQNEMRDKFEIVIE